MIAQKLDLLMKVTNTQNSTLGRALSFDSSYIGRIRMGKRGLPKNQPFIEPAAAFFVRNMREQYQKATIAEAVCPGRSWPENKQEAEALLVAWLSRNDSADNPVGRLLESLSAAPIRREPSQSACQPYNAVTERRLYYYGNSGKRDAVEAFLSDLCALDAPQTLLLYSDEDLSWLYEDGTFARRWAALLTTFISKGGRIKIIHTISRDIGEMLEAVQKWLPLYSSGAIEPYFYPKLRDNVYHRTLFIAKGYSALISNSVGSHTQEALNILLHDVGAVHALELEFADYFSLCKPLMQIFSLRNAEQFWDKLKEFEKASGNLIVMQPVLSHFTMPKSVAVSMAARTGCKWLLHNHENSVRRFELCLEQGFSVTEIVRLPSPEQVRGGGIVVPMCDLFGQPGLCYTPEEFKNHLEEMLAFLRRYENYRVILSDHKTEDAILWAKEDIGAIMLRPTPPTTVFGISEQRMTAAFWEHLQRLVNKIPAKEQTLKYIEDYIELL